MFIRWRMFITDNTVLGNHIWIPHTPCGRFKKHFAQLTHSLTHSHTLLTDSNDGFPQPSVLHASHGWWNLCLDEAGPQKFWLVVRLIFCPGWVSMSPVLILFFLHFSCSDEQIVAFFYIWVVILGRSPYNSLLVIWSFLALHELDFFLYFSLENSILSCVTVGLQHILQHLKKLPFSYMIYILPNKTLKYAL